MRLPALLLLLGACDNVPDGVWEPECIEEGRIHRCGGLMDGRRCTLMGVSTGWVVTFEPVADAPYTVDLVADGRESSFRCEQEWTDDGEPYWAAVGDAVWTCDLEGFRFGPLADRIVTTVTVDGHPPLRTTVAPCWTITEPNGRCCGYEYTALSTIPPYGD